MPEFELTVREADALPDRAESLELAREVLYALGGSRLGVSENLERWAASKLFWHDRITELGGQAGRLIVQTTGRERPDPYNPKRELLSLLTLHAEKRADHDGECTDVWCDCDPGLREAAQLVRSYAGLRGRDGKGSLYGGIVHADTSSEARSILGAVCATEARTFRGEERPETVVLSVNPLDFLLVSESACYTSCYRLRGEYRSGALLLWHDRASFIVYASRESLPWGSSFLENGTERRYPTLPYKLYRQIGLADGLQAWLRRPYGSLATGRARAARRLIARALGGTRWTHRAGADLMTGRLVAGAYRDPVTSRVAVTDAPAPIFPQAVELASTAPCIRCATYTPHPIGHCQR